MPPRKQRGGRASGASGSRDRGPPPARNRQTPEDGFHGRPGTSSPETVPRAQASATPRNLSTSEQDTSTASVAARSSSSAPSTSAQNPLPPVGGQSANVRNPPTSDPQTGRAPATTASTTPSLHLPPGPARALSGWSLLFETRGDSTSTSMQGRSLVDNTSLTQGATRNQGPRKWEAQPSSQGAGAGPSRQSLPAVDNRQRIQAGRGGRDYRSRGEQSSSQGACPSEQHEQIPLAGNRPRREDNRALIRSNLDNSPRFHCNHFPATFTAAVKDKDIYHYTVLIKKLPGPSTSGSSGQKQQAGPSTSVSSGQKQQADDQAADKVVANMQKFKNLNKKVMHALQSNQRDLQPFAYDGVQSLYTMGPLTPESDELQEERKSFIVDLPRIDQPSEEQPAPNQYEVTIKFCKNINPHNIANPTDQVDRDQDVLMALNVLLHHYASAASRDYLTIRQNYYDSKMKSKVGRGLECWTGFHSSFRFSYADPVNSASRRLTLNLNATVTTVYTEQEVAKLLLENLPSRYSMRELISEPWRLKELSEDLNGVRVKVRHTGQTYTIQEITNETSTSKSFEWKGTILSVYEYFQKQYSAVLVLQHVDWPLLLMKGSPKRPPVFMPIEVCDIVKAQPYKKPMKSEQRKAVILKSQMSPKQRKISIGDALGQNAYNEDRIMASFGLNITENMIEVTGHVLKAPELAYGDRNPQGRYISRTFTPKEGNWNFNFKKMIDGKQAPRNWAVYSFVPGNQLKSARQMFNTSDDPGTLVKVCRDKGMEMRAALQLFEEAMGVEKEDPEERIKKMLETINSLELILLVVILPDKTSSLYGPLKRRCETEHGLVTQCVVDHYRDARSTDQYLTNIALKINLKLGGSNSNLQYAPVARTSITSRPSIWEEPTCIFGLDVSHGSPGDTGYPSIAAVVASVEWKTWSRYAPQVRDQAPNTEMITELAFMVAELLMEFRKNLLNSGYKSPKLRGLPSQIIIYRDGVSESQLSQVRTIELPEFRKACTQVGGVNYNPKITLIIVQKRHHTRFFPVDRNDNYNMDPGTVVDNGVCHPTQDGKDFFLCSQKNFINLPQGGGPGATIRPAHYTVLDNEIGFTDREIQDLTNSLCYCFGRATKAVSMPAPAYCAHVAAKHFRNFVVRNDKNLKGYTFEQVHERLKQKDYRMFYI